MGKPRLLVVEDDLDISNMLKIYFSGLESMTWTWPSAALKPWIRPGKYYLI